MSSCSVLLAVCHIRVHCIETAKDTAIVAMECEYETVSKLSSGTIFNDLNDPVTQISRSRHYLTRNISKTVRDRDILTMEY